MKKKTLWRWQELARLSAYEKLCLTGDYHVLIVIVLCVLGMFLSFGNHMSFFMLFGCVILVMLSWELITLCYAKDSFEIEKGNVCYNVYVHKRKGYFLLELVDKQTHKTTTLNVDRFESQLLEPQKSLMYCPKGQKEWYLTAPHSDQLVKLGKRLKPTVFSPKEGQVLALNNGSAKKIPADHIYFKVDSCFLQTLKDVPLQIDDYFVVKYQGKFEVYGITLNHRTAEPVNCFIVKAEVIVARNEKNAIVLHGNAIGEYELIGFRDDLSPLDDLF